MWKSNDKWNGGSERENVKMGQGGLSLHFHVCCVIVIPIETGRVEKNTCDCDSSERLRHSAELSSRLNRTEKYEIYNLS